MRHGIAIGTVYSTWDEAMTNVISQNALAAMEAQNTIPDITWQAQSAHSTVTLAGIAAGDYDSYITASAQTLKAFGQPVFIRLFHEFNTTRYAWGLPQNGAGPVADANFIAAWQHVVTIFRQVGASNVKFIWCFNSGTSPVESWNEPPAAYPGDSYVDWVALDGYNMGSYNNGRRWYAFTFMMGGAYNYAIKATENKPIMVTETASNEYGDGGAMKAAWIDAMFSVLTSPNTPYPHLHAISWYEDNNQSFQYDSISTSPTYQAFATDIRSYAPNGVLNIRSNGNALFSITSP